MIPYILAAFCHHALISASLICPKLGTFQIKAYSNCRPSALMRFPKAVWVSLHLAIAQQRFTDAEKLSREVLVLLVEQDYVINLPDFHYLHGLALAGLGRNAEAREALHAGLKVLRETSGRLWYLEIVSLLIELEDDALSREEARTTLERIIETFPEGDGTPFGGLRASFLALPEVSTVLT